MEGIIGAADHGGKLDIGSTTAKSLIIKQFQVESAKFLRY